MSELTARTGRAGRGRFTAYDQGAHLASWQVEGRPVVWVSSRAAYRSDTAIRGGVPLCWPWFAAGPSGDVFPAHGFARMAPWTLVSRAEEPHSARLEWRLTDADIGDLPGAQRFAHRFEARCTVSVTDSVTVALGVHNTGEHPFDYEVALHTYLHVGDVRAVRVSGLDGARFWDKVELAHRRQHGELELTGETDRIYHSPGPVQVHDPVLGRVLTVGKHQSADTIVWNPWLQKAAQMSHLAPEEWTEFLCVETGNVGQHAVLLQPGEQHTTATTVSLS